MNKNDKIKCTNDQGQKILKVGNIYSVMRDDGDRIYINEHKRFSFLKNRFEVVK